MSYKKHLLHTTSKDKTWLYFHLPQQKKKLTLAGNFPQLVLIFDKLPNKTCYKYGTSL